MDIKKSNNKEESTFKWWNRKRKKYNLGLFISGAVAFILYLVVVELVILKSEKIWDGEVTIFTILIQGIGYFIMILIANLFYFFGPLLEKIIKPLDKSHYRNLAFNLGFWFSCLLPFSIPVALFITYI